MDKKKTTPSTARDLRVPAPGTCDSGGGRLAHTLVAIVAFFASLGICCTSTKTTRAENVRAQERRGLGWATAFSRDVMVLMGWSERPGTELPSKKCTRHCSVGDLRVKVGCPGVLGKVLMVCLLTVILVHSPSGIAGVSMSTEALSDPDAGKLGAPPSLNGGFLLAMGLSCKHALDGGTAGVRPLPPTGVYRMYTNQEHIAPFSVTVGKGPNFFVKLENYTTRAPVIEMFVRAGETFKVDVPLGTYRLKYGSGPQWYGFDTCFGDRSRGASYSTSDERLIFKITEDISGSWVEGNSVTLYEVLNGNFEDYDISPKDF